MRPVSCVKLFCIAVAAGIFGSAGTSAADPPVSGKFTGDGKEAKLAFVTALKGKPLDGEPRIELIFTEKDLSTAKAPYFDVRKGTFGSALIVTILSDGTILGSVVSHANHKDRGFSIAGTAIVMSDYKVADGKITGKIKTKGEEDVMDQKWQIDIKFEVKAP